MLDQVQRQENDFPVIDNEGKWLFLFPVLVNGVRKSWQGSNRPYRGLVLEVNDHGNVTVWRQFKNGNRREVASRV